MASVSISKHTMGSMCSGQISHIYRLHKNYGNKDIDLCRIGENMVVGCKTAADARNVLRKRIEEVDAVLPPKRVRKDRVVAVEYCIPAPREDMTEEEQVEFLKQAYIGLCKKFGNDNIICGMIHLDERHKYKDVDGEHISRAHLHVIGVPFVENKGINGKQFLTKSTYVEVNKVMDEICESMFGYSFQDGTKQKSRGTVEQLKQGEINANAYEKKLKAEIDAKIKEYEEMYIKPLKAKIKALEEEIEVYQDKMQKNEQLYNARKQMYSEACIKLSEYWDVVRKYFDVNNLAELDKALSNIENIIEKERE